MSESNKPVIIDHEPEPQAQNEKKKHYIKDSSSRILSIAEIHGLDALLSSESPEKPALERALVREKAPRKAPEELRTDP